MSQWYRLLKKSMGVDQVRGGCFGYRQKVFAGLVNSDAYGRGWLGDEAEEPESRCGLYPPAHRIGIAVFPITFQTAITVNSKSNIYFIVSLRKT